MGAATVSSDEEEEYEERDDVQDNEAQVDEDEDDEDEEDEGEDEYEKDDFIVDDVEEEEEAKESSDEEAKARKKKRKKRDAEENYELDEDDYELLQEANVTGFHRPKSQASKTKFKRLKKAGKGGVEDGRGPLSGFSDDEDLEGGRHDHTAEEELKRSLFGDDEGAPPEDIREEDEPEEEEEDIGEDDEMADFIVDEEEVDENGQLVRRRKPKKRGPRQAPGISSIALQEAQEIFGDVEELLNRRKLGLKTDGAEGSEEMEEDEQGYRLGRTSKKKLEEEFEPSILEEKFMTAKDDHIRETDLPERLQLLRELVGAIPPAESKLIEAEWIYDRIFGHLAVPMRREFQHIARMDKVEIVPQIAFVLTQLHENKLEIPFIAMYRKEGCLSLIEEPNHGSNQDGEHRLKQYKALWALLFWDKKWWSLQRRKGILQAAYEKRAGAESGKDSSKEDILERLLESLQVVESEQAVDDVDGKFTLHFPVDEIEVELGQFKRPKRRSYYVVCRKAGLGEIAKQFGLTPEQFGENLQAMYKRHEVEDASSQPEDIAAGHNAGEFDDPQSVLRGARHMAAVEISTEPAVREYVRNMYMEKGVVTTRPTPEGNKAIDPFHQYAGVKWLLNKPLSAFDDGQWLLIQKAEEEKLLEVTVGLPKDVMNETLMQEFETQYLSDGVSRTAQLWNEQRKIILKDAVSNMLLPLMEKEARMLLTVRAKSWVSMECAAQLWKKVSVAPHPRPKSDSDERTEDDGAPRVMACCWGPGNPPITFVMLDPSGEIVNTLYTGSLSLRNGNPEQMQRKKIDQQRLLNFMMEYQPHVVVLGAANLSCRRLKDDIFEAIFKIVEEHPRDLAEGLDMISVVYGDEALPLLYENSHVSIEQLPGQSEIVRRAVALGRYLQNPLAMMATLCGPGKEVLSLKLHSMQCFLTADEVYESIEQIMITVTNQVGVDVNLAASHEWLFAPLQFCSGLGPRKASMMQRSIQGAGRISTRKEMLTNLRLMKKNVFINCCGFLRVCGSGQAASGNQIMDPLDDTRIHPESYELAKKMAEDVYCEDQHQNKEDMDEEMLEMAIEHIKENPNLIKNLDIVEYAGIVQERDGIQKLDSLKDIQMELLHGYRDWRVQYSQPTQDEEFSLLTGEDEDTLAEGRIVNATVRNVQNNRVLCVLESGLLGTIQKEDLSDDRDFDPSEKVSVGSIITCRVKGVQKAKYLVDLTCRGSELRADHWQNRRFRDRYYKQDDSFMRTEQEKARKEREDEKKSFKPRMIVHPQFQNISIAEAIEALADKDVGEVIIRPSSKGPTHLSMTLKFYDGVYTHIDIEEGGKESRDVTSFLRLGKFLKIGDEKFEDLDEVIARYVDPLVSNLKDVLRYRKFRRGTKGEVDETLKQEKQENPMRIVYCFSVSQEHPGAFVLSYLRSVNVHHEYISLYPKGYKFRKRLFDHLDKLVVFFQRHINDPVMENPPHRAVAAIVPMKSPAPAGHGSGVWGGSERPSSAASTGWGEIGWNSNRGAGTDVNWERASTPGSRSGANSWDQTGSKSNRPSGWSTDGQGRTDRGDKRGPQGGTIESQGRGGGGQDGRGDAFAGRWGHDGQAETLEAADHGWDTSREGTGWARSNEGDGNGIGTKQGGLGEKPEDNGWGLAKEDANWGTAPPNKDTGDEGWGARSEPGGWRLDPEASGRQTGHASKDGFINDRAMKDSGAGWRTTEGPENRLGSGLGHAGEDGFTNDSGLKEIGGGWRTGVPENLLAVGLGHVGKDRFIEDKGVKESGGGWGTTERPESFFGGGFANDRGVKESGSGWGTTERLESMVASGWGYSGKDGFMNDKSVKDGGGWDNTERTESFVGGGWGYTGKDGLMNDRAVKGVGGWGNTEPSDNLMGSGWGQVKSDRGWDPPAEVPDSSLVGGWSLNKPGTQEIRSTGWEQPLSMSGRYNWEQAGLVSGGRFGWSSEGRGRHERGFSQGRGETWGRGFRFEGRGHDGRGRSWYR